MQKAGNIIEREKDHLAPDATGSKIFPLCLGTL
jgi:hypothetical protein